MTLVIMAAGMGSRYGGLKQIDPVGPNGEFIIDYSVYDAIKAGFKKIVFIIKRENYDIFKETIGKRVEGLIDVEYVFQDMDNIPGDIKLPEDRIKPFGTTQAIYCCKDIVKENFAIINADDFYGYDAYKKIGEFLKNTKDTEFALVGYEVINTLTENGAVKRGVCYQDGDNLTKLIESNIEKIENKIIATPLNGSAAFEVSTDTLVSMNMFGFTPKIFKYLEEDLEKFIIDNQDDLSKCECLIPDTIFKLIKSNKAKVKVLRTNANWYGVTYKEDRQMIVNKINNMVEDKLYPKNLWK